jgi:hypothetical protein
MSLVWHSEPTLKSVALAMPAGATEDKDDVFIENLNIVLFLSLGVLAVAAAVILLGYSTVVAFYSQQFTEGFLTTSVFSAVLLSIGLGSVKLFLKKREAKRKKTQAFF